MPAVGEHLTAKCYVDHGFLRSVNEPTMLRSGPDEELKLDEQDSTVLNSTYTSPETKIEVPTKKHVDSLHEMNRNRRDLSSVFNDQDNEFDNNTLINLYSVIVNREPISDDDLTTKKYTDDSIGEGTMLRFNKTLENYLKVSVGNDTYNLTKYNKLQIINMTEINSPNIGSDLLQKWHIKCNKKINQSGKTDFLKSTKTNSPTGHSGATSLPPIRNSFMYVENCSNYHGHERVFVSSERIGIIQKHNITFYYNRFSILTNDSKKSIGRFNFSFY